MIRLFILSLTLFTQITFAAPVHEHPQSTDAIAGEILKYINQYRASRGLSALVMNEAANREARRHSQEMAVHAVPFGHTGFSQRMKHLNHSIQDINGGAENVAYNYKTARIVVDGWIKSSGHQRNIVGHYNVTGIGVVRDKAGKLYFTQLFVRTEKNHAHPAQMGRRHVRRTFFIG